MGTIPRPWTMVSQVFPGGGGQTLCGTRLCRRLRRERGVARSTEKWRGAQRAPIYAPQTLARNGGKSPTPARITAANLWNPQLCLARIGREKRARTEARLQSHGRTKRKGVRGSCSVGFVEASPARSERIARLVEIPVHRGRCFSWGRRRPALTCGTHQEMAPGARPRKGDGPRSGNGLNLRLRRPK